MATLTVPTEYGYVLATLICAGIVNQYHAFLVLPERKAAGIAYPAAYASNKEAETSLKHYRFNCAQRAHSNYQENLPQVMVMTAIAGLQYPKLTAGLGMLWLVGRITYAKGYINSTIEQKGSGRYKGIFHLPAVLGMLGLSAKVTYDMIMAAL